MHFPLDKHIVDSICRQFGLRNFNELGTASIRQLAGVVRNIEQATGVEYVNMALGEPGLPASMIGIEAEHQALLNGILVSIERTENGLRQQLPTDLVAEDVRMALHDLGELTGTVSSDDILNNIFGKFCIGK